MPAITVAMRTEISQLYVSLFGRAPDGEGLGFWTKSYSDGNTIAKIAQSMYDTAPARAYYPLFATPSEVVTTFYTNVLGRAPDAEGLAFWVKEYNASATQGAFFEKLIGNVVNYNGTDAAGITSKSLFTNKVSVAQYYGEQNGTVAGATAALNGVTSVASTVDTAKAAVVNTAITGQSFTLTTGIDNGSTFTGGANQDAFNATHLTLNASDVLVGGAGTDSLSIVNTGTAGFAVPAAIVSGIENISIRNLNTGTAVGTSAVAQVNTYSIPVPNGGTSVVAVLNFGGISTNFTTGTGSTTHGEALAAAINQSAGRTIAVFTASGNTANTAGSLVVTAPVAGTALPAITLSAALTANVPAVTFSTANVVGIATVTVTDSITATNFTDATTFTSDNSSGAVTITGLTAAQTAVKKAGAGDFSPAFGTTVAAGTVEINGGSTAGAVVTTGLALTTATINSTGAANTIGLLTGAGTATSTTINATTALTTGTATNLGATVTVNGAGNVSFGTSALETGVTTLNAAGLTGTLTAVLSATASVKVTGGSGNDVITTGVALTTGSVDAGAGTGDVLVLGANVTHANTTALASKFTNFEILRVNGTFDMALFPAFTAVQLAGATNTITNLNATQAAAITARANIGATTLALTNSAGTSDVLAVNFSSTTASTNALTSGVITATGFETINLTTTPGASIAGGANRVTTVTGAIVDTSLTNVNLNGTSYTFTDITSSKAVTWNASALTGNGAATPVGLTVSSTSGSFAGSIITGSAFRDSITMETSTGLTMNLGAGGDVVSTTTTLLLPSGAATDNTLNGGDGTDSLVITGAASATDTTFTKVTGFEALQLAGGAVDNSVTGLAAGFLAAFPTGVSVTDTATQADAQAFTWSSGLYSGNVTLVHTTDATGTDVTANQQITTGGGNDSITLVAANYTGASSATILSVATGAGNDTISVTTGGLVTTHVTTNAIVVDGGAGQDAITLVHVNGAATTKLLANARVVLTAGQSSTTAYDTVTGFLKGDGTGVSDSLDFSTTATVTAYAATAATGYTAGQLTVAVATTTGLVTFAGTSAAALTAAEKIAAVASVVATTNGDTAFWIDNGSTYVFNNSTAGDVVVQLVAQTGATSLLTTNAATNLGIHIM